MAGERVLIVDDVPDINELVQRRLTSRGYSTVQAFDGFEALDKVQSVHPDLVLLDVSMPGMSGLDVLRQIREQALDMAVVIMTAHGSETIASEALRVGANDYIRKPFTTQELLSSVDRNLEKLRLTRENEDLRRKLAETVRLLQGELRTAATIQSTLLPPVPANIPGFDVAAICRPAHEVGGDFYDCLLREDKLLVTVGDVSGKGVLAALIMGIARTVLRSESAHAPPSEATAAANSILFQDLANAGLFVTVFLLEADLNDHSLTYVDAGHGHALLWRARPRRCERLPAGGLPLGILPQGTYDSARLQLESDDLLVLYSDGITETIGGDGALFGIERVEQVVAAEPAGGDAGMLRQSLIEAVEAFSRGSAQADDQTVLVIKRSPPLG